MATVKRNKQGEITHIRVGAKFYTKEDADKINFSQVDVKKYLKQHKKEDMVALVSNLANETLSVEQLRINILMFNGEIKKGID